MLKVKRRIAVAIGNKKAKAILGAARAGLFNELVTNESTAEAIFSLF
jgi:DNA-binding transcriptional regulator LsrR (DeoR family)